MASRLGPFYDRLPRNKRELDFIEIEMEKREDIMREINNVAIHRTMYQSFCDRISWLSDISGNFTGHRYC